MRYLRDVRVPVCDCHCIRICNCLSKEEIEEIIKDEAMTYLRDVKVPMDRHEEALRLQCLKLPNQYSRYFDICPEREDLFTFPWPPRCRNPLDDKELREIGKRVVETNVLAPFFSIGKRTAGYLFDPKSDNRRRKTGLSTMNIGPWKAYKKN